MTDAQLTTTRPADDGWADAAQEAGARTIRGTLLKFADWRWTAGKENSRVEDGTRLVALATAAMWVRWSGGKPVEYRPREPGRPLPEREELGYLDEAQWEIGRNGKPQDPWSNTRLVYLVDPQTAAAYTFSTNSWGGRDAVSDLGDQITRMRKRHPDATPLVELRAAEKRTDYGRKSRPVFKVVGWKTADGTPSKQAPVERTLPPPSVRDDMDDEIPF